MVNILDALANRVEKSKSITDLSSLLEEGVFLCDKNGLIESKEWISRELIGFNFPIPSYWMSENDNFEYREAVCTFKNLLGIDVSYFFSDVPKKFVLPYGVFRIENAIENRENIEIKFSIYNNADGWEGHVKKIIYDHRDMGNTLLMTKLKYIEKIKKWALAYNTLCVTENKVKENNIEQLIVDGKIRQAIEMISANNVDFTNEKIMLLSKFNHIENQFNNGVVKYEDYLLELNRIKYALTEKIPPPK